MSPDEAQEHDVVQKVDGLTFVINERDAKFLQQMGGINIGENRLWGGLSIKQRGSFGIPRRC